MISDLTYIAQWWFVFFITGIIFLPTTSIIFSSFIDRGYIFSKIIGIAFVSYAIFILGIFKIFPFTPQTIILAIILFVGINIFIFKKYLSPTIKQFNNSAIRIFIFEEFLFFISLAFWSYIRGFQPDIHGLEKYMDYGFINSILRSEYFPPHDMWFTPLSINYYYFGHLVTAVLTKASLIPVNITYNLMMATILAFTFTGSFSIGANMIYLLKSQISNLKSQINSNKQKNKPFENLKNWDLFGNWKLEFGILAAGLLTAFLATFAGNLHTIYTFFTPYTNENPVPFWQLPFSIETFPNNYWYPNATRFIHNTIHEFPLYSFIVSDLHGHVLDIPFVLLTIAVLLSLIFNFQFSIFNQTKNSKHFGFLDFRNWNLFRFLLLAFLLAIMYMTNAWDGIIYFLLTFLVILYTQWQRIQQNKNSNTTNNPILQILPINKKMQNYLLNNWVIDLFIGLFVYLFILGAGFFLFSLPFSQNFKPFVSGIGVLCAPNFLTDIGKLGPFLFEKDHCQHSPWWQLLILHGFFYFWAISFLTFLIKKENHKSQITNHKQNTSVQSSKRFGYWDLFGAWNLKIGILTSSDVFVLLLILLSTILIIIPELIYAKDIYPAHYRANTMFKLGYQAFIMLSIASGYIIVRILSHSKPQTSNLKPQINSNSQISKRFGYFNIRHWELFGIWILGFGIFALVAIYPYFATNSYYGNLSTYYGLDGTAYLKKLYPTDYDAIEWINKNIKGQPVILEAQGDSYTDYARISSHTGLPTLLGWTVHEWLWRGSYDIPSPRIEEIKTIYELNDITKIKQLIKKYQISYIFIGDLERQKHPAINEEKLSSLGKRIYKNGKTSIYKIDSI